MYHLSIHAVFNKIWLTLHCNNTLPTSLPKDMNQLRKYIWLIDTIRRAGKISHKDLSDKWERNKELSDNKPLHRATFNRWHDAIDSQFGITIDCQKVGGYLYYIANPEDVDDDKLKSGCLTHFQLAIPSARTSRWKVA